MDHHGQGYVVMKKIATVRVFTNTGNTYTTTMSPFRGEQHESLQNIQEEIRNDHALTLSQIKNSIEIIEIELYELYHYHKKEIFKTHNTRSKIHVLDYVLPR